MGRVVGLRHRPVLLKFPICCSSLKLFPLNTRQRERDIYIDIFRRKRVKLIRNVGLLVAISFAVEPVSAAFALVQANLLPCTLV